MARSEALPFHSAAAISLPRLLLLSGGSLVAQNILDALGFRRPELYLAATNSIADTEALFACDAVYLTPPTSAGMAFDVRLQEIVAQEQPDLLIPCRDDDVLFLAQLARRQPELAARCLCGSPELAEAMCDKWMSWQFSQQHGLPFVPTLVTPAEPHVALAFAHEQGFPLLAKPRQGFSSRGISLILDEAQLLQVLSREAYVLQRYLGDAAEVSQYLTQIRQVGLPLFHSFEGLKRSIQIWIGPQGEPLGFFCSRNVNRHGTSVSLAVDSDPEVQHLAKQCLQVFSEAGWRGPVNIQAQKTPAGQVLIYEYNGRISGATAARAWMGFDELGLMLQAFVKRKLSTLERPGITQVQRRMLDGAVAVSACAHLQAHGVWYATQK